MFDGFSPRLVYWSEDEHAKKKKKKKREREMLIKK